MNCDEKSVCEDEPMAASDVDYSNNEPSESSGSIGLVTETLGTVQLENTNNVVNDTISEEKPSSKKRKFERPPPYVDSMGMLYPWARGLGYNCTWKIGDPGGPGYCLCPDCHNLYATVQKKVHKIAAKQVEDMLHKLLLEKRYETLYNTTTEITIKIPPIDLNSLEVFEVR